MTTPRAENRKPRGRDLGLPFNGKTGPHNAITDVAGIGVGFRTIIESELRPGRKRLVRTGVTAILPHMESKRRCRPTLAFTGSMATVK